MSSRWCSITTRAGSHGFQVCMLFLPRQYYHYKILLPQGTHQTLTRLEVGIDANQKTFVAHPSVQQLLAAIWYDGLPGFRRLHVVRQIICVIKHACMFPIFSTAYILAPNSRMGQLAKKPFLKFIFESASYMFFLLLLALASQQIEHIIIDIISNFFLKIRRQV